MTQEKKNKIIGSCMLVVIVGIPGFFIFGPLFTIVFAVILFANAFKEDKKKGTPKTKG